MSNKYHYDLKNVHYAKATVGEDGSFTYAPPVRLRGSISLEVSPEGDTFKQRADGIDYITLMTNSGYTGTLALVMVEDTFKVDCLGETVDTLNSIQYEDANAEPNPFALLFEFVGDVKNTRHVLYNNIAKRPSLKGENKENQKEPDTEELELTASPAVLIIDGEQKSIVKASTTKETKADVYEKWYTQVIIPEKAPSQDPEPANLDNGGE